MRNLTRLGSVLTLATVGALALLACEQPIPVPTSAPTFTPSPSPAPTLTATPPVPPSLTPTSSRIEDDNGWSEPVNITNSPEGNEDRFLITANLISWLELGGSMALKMTQYLDDQWTVPIQVPPLVGAPDGWNSSDWHGAVDQSGTIHIFGASPPTQGAYSSEVWYESKPLNSAWTRSQRIFVNPSRSASGVTSVAFDRSGRMHVSIWAASGDPAASVAWYINRSHEGTWSEPEHLNFISNTAAILFVDDTDTVHLIWGHRATRTWKHTTRNLDGNSNWHDPQVITPPTDDAWDSGFVMDKRAAFHFLWLSYAGEFTNDLYYAVKPSQGPVSVPVNVSRTTTPWEYVERNPRQFSIAVGEDGSVHIVWLERTPNWDKADKSLGNLQPRLQVFSLTDEELEVVRDRGLPEWPAYDNREIWYVTISPDGRLSDPRRIPLVIPASKYPWLLCALGGTEKPNLASQVGITLSSSARHVFVASGCFAGDVFYVRKHEP